MTVRALIAFMFGLVLVLAFSCCTSQPQPEVRTVVSVRNAHLGGPLFRVFDVNEIDSIDEIPALRELYAVAEECANLTRSYAPVRVFSVSKIEVRNASGWFSSATGMWARGTGWIYIKEGRDPKATATTIVHEYIHYIMQIGHPSANEEIEVCNEYMKELMAE